MKEINSLILPNEDEESIEISNASNEKIFTLNEILDDYASNEKVAEKSANNIENAKKIMLNTFATIEENDTVNECRDKVLCATEIDEEKALEVCNSALNLHPNDPELLTYKLSLLMSNGDLLSAKVIFANLLSIPKIQYSFVSFSAIQDFLTVDVNKNMVLIKKNIKECKKYFPHDERSFLLEADFFKKIDDTKKRMKTLKKGIKKSKNPINCALNLQELMVLSSKFKEGLKLGLKIEVIKDSLFNSNKRTLETDTNLYFNIVCIKGIIDSKIYRGYKVKDSEILCLKEKLEIFESNYLHLSSKLSKDISNIKNSIYMLSGEVNEQIGDRNDEPF